MKIKKIEVKNYKSLVDFQMVDLKPFCAFVGPNACGKSNIFEALEFANFAFRYGTEAPRFFGGRDNIFSFNQKRNVYSELPNNQQSFRFDFDDGIDINFYLNYSFDENERNPVHSSGSLPNPNTDILQLDAFQIRNLEKRREFNFKNQQRLAGYGGEYEQFVDNFFRLFIGNKSLVRIYDSPSYFSKTLKQDGSNLPPVLARIFEDTNRKAEFIEWLRILIPEFHDIELKESASYEQFDFLIYEKFTKKPFTRDLISDGTYNLITLLACVYEGNAPKFLCIEEPENGLHPEAIKLVIDFFREQTEDHGHFIWLNTHSPTLVRCLEIDEIVLVNKINGETRVKQLTEQNKVNIKTDEAWLSNALNGGVPWSALE